MTRGEIVLDEHVNWPVLAALLLAVLGGLAYMVLQPAPAIAPPPTELRRATDELAPSGLVAGPERTPPRPREEAPRAPAITAATQPKDSASSTPIDVPYRFIGKSTAGAQTSIVLFGRGRVVTLHGPGPLDDEYVVEGLFDEYLVLRHVQTGVGKFLEYARRQQVVEPQRNPEDSPQD
jgi:hypothetical protein